MKDIAADRPARAARHARPDMTKEQAVGRARTLKRIAAWGTVAGFLVLWQAAAHHVTGVTSRQTQTSSAQQTGGYGVGNGGGTPYPGGYSYGTGQVQPLTQSTVS